MNATIFKIKYLIIFSGLFKKNPHLMGQNGAISGIIFLTNCKNAQNIVILVLCLQNSLKNWNFNENKRSRFFGGLSR